MTEPRLSVGAPRHPRADAERSPPPLHARSSGHRADFDMFQLPFRVLIEAADPDVAHALLLQAASSTRKCQKEIDYPSTCGK